MIALIEAKKQDIYNPSININELNSCYNGIESVINDQKFNGYQLKKIWEKENSLRIKKTNLRQDSSTIVKINSELKKVIEEYEY